MAESNPRFAEDLAREDKEFKTLLEEFKKEKLEEDKKEKERIKFVEEQKREMEAKKWHGIIMKKVKNLPWRKKKR